MPIVDILSADRVSVSNDLEGVVHNKHEVLERLAMLLARGQETVSSEKIRKVLAAREQLASTGVGGGVAVPHGALAEMKHQVGALLVCPTPVAFEAIDGAPVNIVFALVGPKGAPAQHLRVLAQLFRLLRQQAFRARLTQVADCAEAYALWREADAGASS